MFVFSWNKHMISGQKAHKPKTLDFSRVFARFRAYFKSKFESQIMSKRVTLQGSNRRNKISVNFLL